MRLIHESADLHPFAGSAFVPTMGALHAGHTALIERARASGRAIVVSVFVNPTQFGPNEDFAKYPRTLEADCEKAAAAGADVVFAPAVDTVYPPGETIPPPLLPDVATSPLLEDRIRPGHFEGVCQVVARLFDLVRPAFAVFGEKDYQQLRIIEKMVEQERPRWDDLRIIRHETVREADGLAMSSRNTYLKPEDRPFALGLWRALAHARDAAAPDRDVRRMEEMMRANLIRHRLDVDYAVVRDADTLMPLERLTRPARALIAARLGSVRLIDNIDLGITA